MGCKARGVRQGGCGLAHPMPQRAPAWPRALLVPETGLCTSVLRACRLLLRCRARPEHTPDAAPALAPVPNCGPSCLPCPPARARRRERPEHAAGNRCGLRQHHEAVGGSQGLGPGAGVCCMESGGVPCGLAGAWSGRAHVVAGRVEGVEFWVRSGMVPAGKAEGVRSLVLHVVAAAVGYTYPRRPHCKQACRAQACTQACVWMGCRPRQGRRGHDVG